MNILLKNVPRETIMLSLNKVTLIGTITTKPEKVKLKNDREACYFTLVTFNKFKNKEGSKEIKNFSHRIIVYNEHIIKYLATIPIMKSDVVYIEGTIQYRSYADNNNTRHYITEIILSARGILFKINKNTDFKLV